MNITGQIGSIIYATTPGFQALMQKDFESAENFMAVASGLIKGKTDMVVGDRYFSEEAFYEDEGRTAKVFAHFTEKIYAIVNLTGGITYMLAEEY